MHYVRSSSCGPSSRFLTHLDRTVENQRRRRGRAPYGGGAGVETVLGNTNHRLGLAELAKHGVDGIEGGIDLLPDLNGR